jgi:hypothetical protein
VEGGGAQEEARGDTLAGEALIVTGDLLLEELFFVVG